MLQTRVDSGLDGVIVADTVMSEVDGEEGRLVVRGHALQELVATLEQQYDSLQAEQPDRVPSAEEIAAEFEKFLADREKDD